MVRSERVYVEVYGPPPPEEVPPEEEVPEEEIPEIPEERLSELIKTILYLLIVIGILSALASLLGRR